MHMEDVHLLLPQIVSQTPGSHEIGLMPYL
jgi:hypothetical protein